MQIEQISIRNYRAFKSVELKNLGKMSVFVGRNGAGKTTFFDVFSFLKDSLTHNVSKALSKRGGFSEVVSRQQDGPITITIKFRESGGRLATYELTISLENTRPVVAREILKFRRGSHGQPWHFLDFACGSGTAITNEDEYGQEHSKAKRDQQTLDSPDILAIKGLGQFQRFKVVNDFRKLIDNWHVSDFQIGDARPSQEDGFAEHLSSRGENLSLVAQHIFENHPKIFDQILEAMKRRVPGVSKVSAENTVDGRLVLRFQDGAFKDPFIAKYVSDGTIKMFAYLVLLYDPFPHPLLAVEEPENQLYPDLLPELAEEFRLYAQKGGQVFISTHSPDFLNAIELDEIYVLEKSSDGFTQIVSAVENKLLRNLIDEGDMPGTLWKQGLLEGSSR